MVKKKLDVLITKQNQKKKCIYNWIQSVFVLCLRSTFNLPQRYSYVLTMQIRSSCPTYSTDVTILTTQV